MHLLHARKTFSANSSLGLIFRHLPFLILVLGVGCGGLAVSTEPSSHNPTDLTLPLEIAWTYNARAGFGPDAPLVFGNVVLVATRQGELHSIDLATGKRGGSKRFGDAINGSPIVIGTTLVVSLAQGRRALAAYDLERADMLWRSKGAPVQVGIAPVNSGGIIINTSGEVKRFEVADGSVVWTYQLPERVGVHASPLIYHDTVIIVTDSGTVQALSLSTGQQEWNMDIGYPIYVVPSVYDDTLVVSTTRGHLLAMDVQNGTIIWDTVLGDEGVRLSTPVIDQGTVVVGGSDGGLRLIHLASGETEWTFQCSDALVAPPVITEDLVFTGSMGNWFYAFDRSSGELLQKIELRGRVKSAIGLAESSLIILAEPRYVIQLAPSKADDGA